MPSLASLLAPTGRFLSPHLHRLSESLDDLRGRLRATISTVIGQTVAGAVQEAVRIVLAHRPAVTPSGVRPSERSSLWEDDLPSGRQLEDRTDRYDRRPFSRDAWSDEEYEEELQLRSVPLLRPAHWCTAIAVGCEAVAWWLKRQVGKASVLAALGVGVLAGVTAFAVGTVLSKSALGLNNLAETLRSSVALLASLGST